MVVSALEALGESWVTSTYPPRTMAALGTVRALAASATTISALAFMPGRRPSVSSMRMVTG